MRQPKTQSDHFPPLLKEPQEPELTQVPIEEEMEDSQRSRNQLSAVSSDHVQLSNFSGLLLVFNKSFPFAFTRFIYTVNTMAIGWTVGQLGKEQVAAGTFFTSLQYLLVGSPQGMMLSTGIPVAEKYGVKDYAEIGKISRASWKLALLTSLFSVSALLVSPLIIKSAHLTQGKELEYVKEYLYYFSIAVPAILIAISEQQVAVATKDSKVTLGFITIYSGLASGLGIPMTLGMLGNSTSGIKGYGISTALSSWLGLLALRIYFLFNPRYKKFELFKRSYPSDNNYFRDLLSLGWKFCAQAGSEFANLLCTSALLSAYGTHNKVPALEMIAPSVQIASAWGLVAIGLGQGQGSLISAERAAMRKMLEAGNRQSAEKAQHNINTICRQGSLLGIILSIGLALACFLKPEIFTDLFLSNDIDDQHEKKAIELLQISSISLVLDMVRNVYAGSLKGFRDINYSTVTSFFSMTVIFLGVGAVFLYKEHSLTDFMWLRNATIASAMLASIVRWYSYARMDIEKQAVVNFKENNSGEEDKKSFLMDFFKNTLGKISRSPLIAEGNAAHLLSSGV